MARMYSKRKGKSGSHHPKRAKHPEWSALNPREIESHILDLSKEGKSTSEIGIKLRDQYAVPDVKVATGKRIMEILEKNNMQPEVPEDLRSLIHTSLRLQKHLAGNKKDLKNRKSLQLTESKIWRLTKYYHRSKRLPKEWKYTPQKAKLMFE